MNKKGLALVYDPHNLYQFIWYYCSSKEKKKWDALSLPNGYKGEYMHTFCEKTEIFENIYKDDTDFGTMSFLKKIRLMFLMLLYFIFGQRTRFCKKLLNEFVPLDEYDEIVVIADVGLVSGACVALGKEKKVVILEDGINDYGERPRFIPKEKLTSVYSWQGFILAAMGYCSPGWFKFNADRNCIKYASQPDKMKYREYKELRLLYSEESLDKNLFNQIITRIYPAISGIDFSSFDAILLTRPLEDFIKGKEKYLERMGKYIKENYSSVLIKKHPREKEKYDFGSTVKITEVDNSVPAEVLLPYLKDKEIVIVTTSAISLYMSAYGLKCKIIYFDGLYEESLGANSMFRPLSEEATVAYCEKFAQGCYEIVRL